MNKIELIRKSIQLNQTVVKSFEFIRSTLPSNPLNAGAVLPDIIEAVRSIAAISAQILPEKTAREIDVSGQKLISAVGETVLSSVTEDLFNEVAAAWTDVSMYGLYSAGIEAVNICQKSNIQQGIRLLELITSNKIFPEQHALALFVLSRKLSSEEPLRAYELGMEAFRTAKNLAVIVTVEKSPAHNYIFHEVTDTYLECCPSCHGEGAPFFCAAPLFMEDFSNAFNPFRLWMKCTSCDLIYAYNFPELLLKPQDSDAEVRPKCVMAPKFSLQLFGDILSTAETFTKGKRLLEVGAGGGEMIAAALELGYDVTAIELIRPQAAWLSELFGITVLGIDFMSYSDQRRFDVITMGDVLEHVADPVGMLTKACALLEDDGLLWISTPNYKSGFSRITRFEDPMWNEPSHVTYFSYDILKTVLAEIGITVVKYRISARYNGSMEIMAVKTPRP